MINMHAETKTLDKHMKIIEEYESTLQKYRQLLEEMAKKGQQ